MPVSIFSCNLSRDVRNLSTIKASGLDGSSGSSGGTYQLRYEIMMASLSGPLNVCIQALTGSPHPLPSLWSTYSYAGDTDAHSFAKRYQIDGDEKRLDRYYVTVFYEPAEPGEIPDISNHTTPNAAPIKSEPNPLLRSPVYWWDREVVAKTSTVDVNGYAHRNYAGELYEDLIEFEAPRSLLVVEFPVASNNDFIDLSQKYDQAVNAAQWTFKLKNYPARNVLCREVSCSPLIAEGQYRYYTATLRFAFAPTGKTWDVPIPEMGRSYYTKKPSGVFETDPAGYKKRTVVDYLVPLEMDGTRRSDDQPVLVTQTRPHREIDFNPLTQGNAWNSV